MSNSSALDVQAAEERFIKLETKLAYQEKTIADLNDVVVTQSRALDVLERRFKRLEQQLETGLATDPTPEKPPHY